jgi:hypothetical protein
MDNTCQWGHTWDAIYIITRRTAWGAAVAYLVREHARFVLCPPTTLASTEYNTDDELTRQARDRRIASVKRLTGPRHFRKCSAWFADLCSADLQGRADWALPLLELLDALRATHLRLVPAPANIISMTTCQIQTGWSPHSDRGSNEVQMRFI